MENSLIDQFNLSGRTAIVTGGSRGIGKATARILAECGACVVVSSRKQESLDAAVKELADAGLDVSGMVCHMGDARDIDQFTRRIEEQFDGVDILVNNAATNPVFGPLLEMDGNVFDKIAGVNIKGPFELSRRIHPLMVKRSGGSIINISSVGGLTPEPSLGLYSMSKAALISLSKVMALEWGSDGIRVNVVCPGLVRTDFSAALWKNEAILQRLMQRLPLGRIGQPEEIAALIAFLASPASSFCTGAVFTADGGHTV